MVIAFLIALTLFIFIKSSSIKTIESFEEVYKTDRTIILKSQQKHANDITGQNILLQMYNGLKYKTTVNGISLKEDTDPGIIDPMAQYSREIVLDNQGNVIEIRYSKK